MSYYVRVSGKQKRAPCPCSIFSRPSRSCSREPGRSQATCTPGLRNSLWACSWRCMTGEGAEGTRTSRAVFGCHWSSTIWCCLMFAYGLMYKMASLCSTRVLLILEGNEEDTFISFTNTSDPWIAKRKKKSTLLSLIQTRFCSRDHAHPLLWQLYTYACKNVHFSFESLELISSHISLWPIINFVLFCFLSGTSLNNLCMYG